MTLGMLLMLALVAIALVLTGSLATAVGDAIGVGKGTVDVWNVAKWPVMLLVVGTMFALLYYIAPNVRQPKFRWITPGGALAVLLWVAASAGFGLYIAHLGSYDKTYGALGSVVIFLVWMWITNLACPARRGVRRRAGARARAGGGPARRGPDPARRASRPAIRKSVPGVGFEPTRP